MKYTVNIYIDVFQYILDPSGTVSLPLLSHSNKKYLDEGWINIAVHYNRCITFGHSQVPYPIPVFGNSITVLEDNSITVLQYNSITG